MGLGNFGFLPHDLLAQTLALGRDVHLHQQQEAIGVHDSDRGRVGLGMLQRQNIT
jgi:hypothetical protein